MLLPKLITACAALCLFSSAAAAAPVPCASRVELLKLLAGKYQEVQVGYGVVAEKSVIEVYKSEKGSFTILSSFPNGVSCIIVAGQNWEDVEPPKKLTATRL